LIGRSRMNPIIMLSAEARSMMIGFILDRPINMMGHSGWSTMKTWVHGPNRPR